MNGIKNILFDYGGVIISIDYQAPESFLSNLGFSGFAELYSKSQQTSLFSNFEIGLISESQFFQSLQTNFPNLPAIHLLQQAWNAMLGTISPIQLTDLISLRKTYNLALFSNTNETHIRAVDAYFEETHGGTIRDYFDQVHYSHILHNRKPHPEAFQAVLQQLNWNPSETLFIDDSPGHLEGAKAIGMHTVLHTTNDPFMPTIHRFLNAE